MQIIQLSIAFFGLKSFTYFCGPACSSKKWSNSWVMVNLWRCRWC